MNVQGNRMMDALSKELDFPFKRNGSLVLCFDEDNLPGLEELRERAEANGVPDVRIVAGDEIKALEPNLSPDVKAVLYAPTGGIVCPFKMTIALAENSYVNGVDFHFNTEVTDITRTAEGYLVHTAKGDFAARCVVNAAGVYADQFNNMVSAHKLHITPRKGEYILMDKKAGDFVTHTIFQQPTRLGKGILVTPTVRGNLLAGPTAEDITDKEEVCTTGEGLAQVVDKARLSAEKSLSIWQSLLLQAFAPVRKRVILSWAKRRMRRAFITRQVSILPDFPALRPSDFSWLSRSQGN